jgi:Ca2+:H+ antiporter
MIIFYFIFYIIHSTVGVPGPVVDRGFPGKGGRVRVLGKFSSPPHLPTMAAQQPSDSSIPPDDLSSGPHSPTYPSRFPARRSVSHTPQWTATDIPSHHNAGTSYSSQYSTPVSPSPQRKTLVRSSSGTNTTRLRIRTASTSSRMRDSDQLSDDDEEASEQALEAEQVGDVRGKRAAAVTDGSDGHTNEDDADEEDPITLKDRQSLINVEHPFGLPIWKPALYKKSRSVTRYADQALHSIPSAQAGRHLLPGNILWAVFVGWWLSLVCLIISALLWIVPRGGRHYSFLVYGLGWYLFWPFGKYVEGQIDELDEEGKSAAKPQGDSAFHSRNGSDSETIRGPSHVRERQDDDSQARGPSTQFTPSRPQVGHGQSVSWSDVPIPNETSSLLGRVDSVTLGPSKSYGTAYSSVRRGPITVSATDDIIGRICFWLALVTVIAPLMLFVCVICWGLIIAIPMAKLNWALIKYLFKHPTSIRFCSAPSVVFLPAEGIFPQDAGENGGTSTPMRVRPRLSAGQDAPSGAPSSKVLLCIYRAIGWKFYKYTIGGINIFVINLLPIVFFVIFDAWVLSPIVEERERTGQPVPVFLAIISSRLLIFLLSLLSVIPLSYFIGMAVASISAQSSIGMGAVINATFGSIVEILLYAFALTEGKGRLVEGSIVGSLLAGVLLMPGMSMISVAMRRKEQKFNAKSAGVTSTMLIMAIIGTLTPTLFYQTYGNVRLTAHIRISSGLTFECHLLLPLQFQLVCEGCADKKSHSGSWGCRHCSYKHLDPVHDPFYQSTVKSLMYICAGVLLFVGPSILHVTYQLTVHPLQSYLVGLWFSLRTHASQIWQNPQQLLHPQESGRMSLYHKIVPPSNLIPGVSKPGPRDTNMARPKPSITVTDAVSSSSHGAATIPQSADAAPADPSADTSSSAPSTLGRAFSPNPPVSPTPGSLVPIMESVDHALKDTGLQPAQLTPDDFTRAVAVATVSALRHQQVQARRVRVGIEDEDHVGHAGHDGPSWSRALSASVLLACTALYAAIAGTCVHNTLPIIPSCFASHC